MKGHRVFMLPVVLVLLLGLVLLCAGFALEEM
ncbi:site-specific recombinase [Streptomyces pratensis]|nr:site-specific recombinase [Streptomyces pratensis]